MDLFDLVAKLTLDTSEYDQGLKDSESNASSFGSKLGTAAKVGAGAMAGLTAAGAAAGAAFVKGASNVASYGDTIDKESQKLGISATAYQEWDAILQHTGGSVSNLKPALKTLSKEIMNNSDAFQELGISQDEMKNASVEEVLAKTITKLQEMPPGVERTRLATQLLGKSSVELGALLNTSAEDTEKMRQAVHDLGGVMSDDAVKAAAQYEDSLQDMNTAIDGVKRGIMSSFLPSLSTAMDGIAQLFSGDSDEGLGKIKDGVSKFIKTLSDTIPKVIEVGGKIINALVTAIVENLPSLLKAGIQSIVSLVKGISQSLPKLIPAIVDAVLTMAETLLDNIDLLIEAAADLMVGLAEGLVEAIPKIIEKIPTIISKIVEALINSAPKIATAGVELLTSLIKNLPKIIATIVKAIPQIISGIVTAIGKGVSKLVTSGEKLLGGLKSGLSKFSGVMEKVKELREKIKGVFTNIGESFKTFGKNMLTGIGNGIVEFRSNLMEKFTTLKTRIIEAFKKLPEQFVTVGKNLMTGLQNGITEKITSVVNKVKEFGGNILDAINKVFGNASPSKEFKKIGGYLMQGMAIGIEDNMGLVEDAMDELGDMTFAEVPTTDLATDTSTTTTSYDDGTGYFTVPRQAEQKQLTVILELDRMVLGRTVYNLNNEETQRVGVRLAGVGGIA